MHFDDFANAVRDVVVGTPDRPVLDLVSFLDSLGQLRRTDRAPDEVASPGIVFLLFRPVAVVSDDPAEQKI